MSGVRHQFDRRALRHALLGAGAALIAIAHSSAALAQAAPPPQDAAPPARDEIVVTGSRIVTPNFNAPTPVQSVGADQIAANAQPNIFNTVAQLPSLQGSLGATVNTNSTSSGLQGLSSLALRGLGTIRTLTLLDGQRVVGANVTGVPDISLFPQLLIKRVDVVTGGASASYGSDAVGGVVNFITDKHFTGVKGNIQGGLTTYGDNRQVTAQLALGQAFLDGKLHVVVSGEYDDEAGVGAGGFGEEQPNGRNWYRTATFLDSGVGPVGGGPQYHVGEHAQAYLYTKYGLITAGPLQGTAFDVNGTPFPFVYGSSLAGVQGTPAKDKNGTVNNCYVSFCVGGDLSGNVGIGTTMQSSLERLDGYTRIGYEFLPHNEIFFTANVSRVKTMNQPNPGAAKQGSLTLQCSNPYVPIAIQTACAANGITSFKYGTSNAILPNITVHPTRKQFRFVGGIEGTFNLLGTGWNYDSYFEHGENITDISVRDITLNSRYDAAIQAVLVNGQIVCANPLATGCQPLNIIGGARPSAATLAYVAPAASPYQHTRQTQNVFSVNVSGEPIKLWAGPVSVATGFEYRKEFYKVTGDPYSNGNGAASGPEASLYPIDPILNPAGNNWFAGNYRSGGGKYNVAEGFLEVNLPVVNSEALGKGNLNGGARITNYSTSGTVWTWKVGGTWDTPLDGFRLRAVTSRDVRAPNLSELFAAGSSVNLPSFTNPFYDPNDPSKGAAAVNVLQITTGNPDLKPEVARNTTFGAVLARPHWAPGLSLSVDYYKINVSGVISSLSATQVVDFCKAGTLTNCAGLFVLNMPGGTGNFVKTQSFNFNRLFTDGLDIEASYQFADPLGMKGRLTLRGLATRVLHNTSYSGIPGTDPVESAGANSGATPDWKVLGSQSFDTSAWRLTVQERWFSDGVYSNAFVECQSNCPLSTSQHRTIDNNFMPGALYIDVSGSYNINKSGQIYFKVDNLFDKAPAGSPQTNTGIDVNPTLYDVIGRTYRIGLRFSF